jgi:hypothetical protein
LDTFAATRLLGELQDFALHSSKFFRNRFAYHSHLYFALSENIISIGTICRELSIENAIVELAQAHQAARTVSTPYRELIIDLLLEKIHFESGEAIQEALLNECIFLLENKWHPFTKDQCLTLFTTLSGTLGDMNSSRAISFKAMQHLVSSQKLTPDMLGKLLRSIDTNLTISKQDPKTRQFQVFNAELLRSVLPQLDAPGSSCDQEIVNIFQLARQICYTDFAGFVGFDKYAVVFSSLPLRPSQLQFPPELIYFVK